MNDDCLREQIDLYVAGMLDEAERKVVEDAIACNARAARWLAESQHTWQTLDADDMDMASPDIVSEAWLRTRRSRSRKRRWTAGLSAAAAIAISATVYLHVGEKETPPVVLSPQDSEIVEDLEFLEDIELWEQMDLVRRAGLLDGLRESGLDEFLEALAS